MSMRGFMFGFEGIHRCLGILATLGLLFGISLAVASERVEFNSKDFLKEQKTNYLESRWDVFFGGMKAYRSAWQEQYPLSDLVVLEAMGLARFCRYSEAQILIQKAEELNRRETPSPHSIQTATQIRNLKALVTSLDRLEVQVPAGKTTHSPEVWWPAHTDVIRRFHPRVFRARVEGRCS